VSQSLPSGPSGERGQVLVITAVALVVLLGIGALVVDLGFGVALRRQEQNAVDPGSIAAARFIDDVTGQSINRPMAEQAACHYARQNGFFPSATANGLGPSGCVPANDPQGGVLEVLYPPDARAGQFQGHHGFVQVVLTRHRDTFFGRILGIPTLKVETGAVAARQRGNTNTHSLVALNPEDCASGWVHGNGTITIEPVPGYVGDGGYVQVNSACGAGSSADDACDNMSGGLRIDGSTTQLTAPKVNVHGGCRSNHSGAIVGDLDEAAVQIGDPLFGLVPPPFNASANGASCGTGGQPLTPTGNFSRGCSGSGPGRHWAPSTGAERAAICPGIAVNVDCIHLHPGVYFGGWNIGSRTAVVLEPGIYFIAGGGITIGSTGSLESVDSGGGGPAPVLLFNTDNPNYGCPGAASHGCQQDLDLTAQGNLKLAGLRADQPCPPASTTGGCPFGGMVIWYDGNGSQASNYSGYVDIQGGVELHLSGTIYAPTAVVDIHGNVNANCSSPNPTQVAAVQIIAWQWKLGGTGDLCMPYDPNQLYKLSLQGLVH
jgi:Putative Flp pilus-assembly TadE/G-like